MHVESYTTWTVKAPVRNVREWTTSINAKTTSYLTGAIKFGRAMTNGVGQK